MLKHVSSVSFLYPQIKLQLHKVVQWPEDDLLYSLNSQAERKMFAVFGEMCHRNPLGNSLQHFPNCLSFLTVFVLFTGLLCLCLLVFQVNLIFLRTQKVKEMLKRNVLIHMYRSETPEGFCHVKHER